MVLFGHCLFGEVSLPGEGNLIDVFVVALVGLRIVAGVGIVFFKIEVEVGLFGDRMDNGSGLSMVAGPFLSFQCPARCKQRNPKKP